ncbi:hypothetical protein [Streptomyces sp. NBC_01751]|uniref:hypothetical protein n=1 Tax=Streptomyces sp. NBC_01751 TaxID=2975929 RepID=UPI002DDADD7C|nr:hypothetical protein [Streptomyces sp. NBC_01751]WSD23387.1 hypothetical protein OHA26_07785 [Streptomyces sp. NBC_01751]
MKVKILEAGTGLLDGKPFPDAGEIVELPSGLAVSLLGDNRAELVAEKAAERRETAATAAPEKRGAGRPRKSV